MDIKAKIEEIVKKVQADPNLLASFQKDPVKTIEGLSGIDIPDGMEEQIVGGVKAALAGDMLSQAAGAVQGLFGKKAE